MVWPRGILMRGLLAGALAAALGAGAFLAYVSWYVGTDRILPGVQVGRIPVGGLPVAQARQRLTGNELWRPPVLAGGPGAAGGTPLGGTGGASPQQGEMARLRHQEQVWSLPVAEVGPDPEEAVDRAAAIGRSGPVWQRARIFLVGLVHGHLVHVEPSHQHEPDLESHLARIAAELEQQPTDARYDFETDTLTEEQPGQRLDLQASLEEIRRAKEAGRQEADLVVLSVEPEVKRADVAQARQHQIASYSTRILAADPGRVQNITMAVEKISGTVIRPGQTFSFNEVVGPRDAANGWAQAAELYQGEFVMGYGGGICQVSSTLYNTVLLAGIEVRERYHHDRPLAYIDPGRDATVAWELLDFRFRNNLPGSVILGARVLPGSPQKIEVTLNASRPAEDGRIYLEQGDVRYFPPEMEEVLDPTLPGDVREVVDEGHYGIEVKLYRVFREGGKERRELVSHDHYQPKNGKVRVGVGNAPGSDRLLDPGLH
jgi:vancomycin resistance protein YoaR